MFIYIYIYIYNLETAHRNALKPKISFQLKNETLIGTKLTTLHDMFKMSIIEPFRATMYITRASPSPSRDQALNLSLQLSRQSLSSLQWRQSYSSRRHMITIDLFFINTIDHLFECMLLLMNENLRIFIVLSHFLNETVLSYIKFKTTLRSIHILCYYYLLKWKEYGNLKLQ